MEQWPWMTVGSIWLALLVCLAPSASAGKLVGFVSESSAPALASAAREFCEVHAGHEVVLRTPEQLAVMTDEELAGLWRDADAVLLAAVFGEAAPRLARLLEADPPPLSANVFAVSGDRRLTVASRFQEVRPLAELEAAALNAVTSQPHAGVTLSEHFDALAAGYPAQARWLRGRHYWQARGGQNLRDLIAWLLLHGAELDRLPLPAERPSARFYHAGRMVQLDTLTVEPTQRWILLVDYDTGDQGGQREIHDELAERFQTRGLNCISTFAQWGEASVAAVQALAAKLGPDSLAGIVTLQDFVVGGGEDRQQAAEVFETLNVPVLKAIRLTERTESQWRLSPDGLPWDSVHYRIAMPELQGQSQPLVVAAAAPPRIDPLTGIELKLLRPIDESLEHVANRLANWHRLRRTANVDKKLAVIFYNHPPGRHNIGADNLDVVESLFDLLYALRDRGYNVGELPGNSTALLDMLQQRAVNLPENREELASMAPHVATLSEAAYRKWFQTLPESVQREMVGGPLAGLTPQVRLGLEAGEVELATRLVNRSIQDIRHMLEGTEHAAQPRALELLSQLERVYSETLAGRADWVEVERLTTALTRTGIEALSGWGAPPGRGMVHADQMLLPGIVFGNVFVGPQPPRGWELDEELLHANTTFPPPHQYLGFYHWLRDEFGAQALIHFGRHSTYEFLPGHRVGLTAADYSLLIAGELPGIYPYIVDGVGEGIQAKRRGLAVIVDHLTPPLRTTPLYDRLLELRQLVESYEAAASGEGESATQQRIIREIRRLVDELELTQALVASMRDVLDQRGISYQEVDGPLLVHEVGHYLTKLQEDFMPMGLHIFGRPWSEEATQTMLESIGGSADSETRSHLVESPAREMTALLNALEGQLVPAGSGNDPVRSPEVLPTGRNFHALNSSLIPTQLAWKLGSEMAEQARAQGAREGAREGGSEAVVLWASDTVRDDGAMVAFGFAMLGVEPQWNSRGILQGLKRLDLPAGRQRHDVVFTTSGLFRDLYQNLLVWLDRAVLMALDASSESIVAAHPELEAALEAALAPLGELRSPGSEDLTGNRVAIQWLASVRGAIGSGVPASQAGRLAALRIFGDAPGAYGAGVNRLVERSGSWDSRDEIADAYLLRMGHAYGDGVEGQSAQGVFKQALGGVRRTYLGRASNLYGLLDNNDAFDYLGGLNLAVERVSGAAPSNHVVDLSDPDRPGVTALEMAVMAELHGRYLNPAWIEPLMSHGYEGARTMNAHFLENFWGWQVTNPEMISDGMWREVKAVYVDDKYQLGLDQFLRQGQNQHVRANMLAVMLVAIEKGFWQADQATVEQLAREFAEQVVAVGLPGSGHTRPDHPILDWIEAHLPDALRNRLRTVRAAARNAPSKPAADPPVIREIELANDGNTATGDAADLLPLAAAAQGKIRDPQANAPQESTAEAVVAAATSDAGLEEQRWVVWLGAAALLLLLAGGVLRGARGARRDEGVNRAGV
jgi:cobaltochelatase CobN